MAKKKSKEDAPLPGQTSLLEAPPPNANTGHEPIRSYCARVINLCYYVEDASGLTDLQALKDAAARVREESMALQTVYGGMLPVPKEKGR